MACYAFLNTKNFQYKFKYESKTSYRHNIECVELTLKDKPLILEF